MLLNILRQISTKFHSSKCKNVKSISKNNCLNESRSKKQSLKKSHCEKQISSKKGGDENE